MYITNFHATYDRRVLFDSSDYSFPPDLIMDPVWHQFSTPDVFPLEWCLDDPRCVHHWLSTLWGNLNQKLFGVKDNEERDELCSYQSASAPPVRTPTSVHQSAPSPAPRREREQQEHEQPRSYEPSISSSQNLSESAINTFSDGIYSSHELRQELTLVETDSAMEVEYQSPFERRAFIEQWISDMPDQVIRFDAEDFASIVLYMTVRIPDVIWNELAVHHQRALMELQGKKVSKAKDTAPAIVQLSMSENFPNSPLTVLLISAINSDPVSKDEPERQEFEMAMNTNWSLEEMCEKIRGMLMEEIPKFHSGLFDQT
ncbi:hypothetical protein BDB00DRAFT_584125 [Zychaea mexicana]|uniref:uncharacterized protein n=1 Tax=Zychaea mexicana TaxID=64656 RepID=UPI0022FE5E0B|nr:uncharacterized protein BDB00DRAFT_584125 [Zychaea mexicana]KAI9497624.1 hypothetical protein BDB00DRAFT_584125 [Zychaea mexicana]